MDDVPTLSASDKAKQTK
jgi:hTAFII28-like protein conserved region